MSKSSDPAASPPASRPALATMRRLADATLRQYGIRGAKLKLLRYYNNVTYRVSASSGERYVLRLTPNFYSSEQLHSELLWLTALQSAPALYVPAPVAALDRGLVVTAVTPGLPQPRLCVLFRWMEGSKVEEERMKASHFRLAGEALARMHHQSELFSPPPDFDRPHWDEERFLSAEMAATREQIHNHLAQYFSAPQVAHFVALTAKVQATMRELAADPASFGLIHGDFHAGNYLFHRGTVRFIDFEDSGWGYFLYDMATALFGIVEGADYEALTTAFCAGYTRIRRLPEQFAARLRQFQILRCIFLTGLVVTHPSLAESQWWEQYVAGKLKRLLEELETKDGGWCR